MIDAGYEEIEGHVSEHAVFKQKVYQLKSMKGGVGSDSLQKLIVFVENWLLNHVLTEDTKFSK